MANQINIDFGKRSSAIKAELEKRAAELHMSTNKYCIMVLTRHVTSGERFRITGG